MSWPTWTTAAPPMGAPVQSTLIPTAINSAPPVMTAMNTAPPVMNPMNTAPPVIGYSQEQWAQAQQQNWQQWAQWQQQYQQWHQQYGAEYQKSLTAMQGALPPPVAVQPPLPAAMAASVAPPLPVENKPPLPPEEPPQKLVHTGYTTTPVHQPAYNWQQPAQKRPHQDVQEPEYQTAKKVTLEKPKQPPVGEEQLSEAEKKFDKEFAAWEAQFNKWKEQNVNHPDKTQYKEYEKKWESWRNSLLDRREQMRRKRLALTVQKPPPTTTGIVDTNKSLLGPYPGPKTPNFSKPPPTITQEYKVNKDEEHSSSPQESGGFLTSSLSSGGIPGLDLVKDDPKEEEEEETKPEPIIIPSDEAENKNKGPDFEAISKGINTILGDQKLLSMLSMVSQNTNSNFGQFSTPVNQPPPPQTDYYQSTERNNFNNPPPGFDERSNRSFDNRNDENIRQMSNDRNIRSHDSFDRNISSLDRPESFDRNISSLDRPGSFDRNISSLDRPESFDRNISSLDRPGSFDRNISSLDRPKSFDRNISSLDRPGSFDRNISSLDRPESFDRNISSLDRPGSFDRNISSLDRPKSFDRNISSLDRPGSFDRNISSLDRPGSFDRNISSLDRPGSFDRNISSLDRSGAPQDRNNRNMGLIDRPPPFDRNVAPPDRNMMGPRSNDGNFNRPNNNGSTNNYDYDDYDKYNEEDDYDKYNDMFKEDDPYHNDNISNKNNDNNGGKKIPSLFDIKVGPIPIAPTPPLIQNYNQQPPVVLPQKKEEVVEDHGLFEPSTVIDYDHKSKRMAEQDVTIEPLNMFDYRHKSLNRIPLPQRPKWLAEAVKFIREFDPTVLRYERPLPVRDDDKMYRRYDDRDRFIRERDYKPYERERHYRDKIPHRDHDRRHEVLTKKSDDFEDLSDTDMDFEHNEQNRHSEDMDIRRSESKSPELSNPPNPSTKKMEITMIEDIINPPGRYNRPPRIVIILRGPPGSGKTFLAKQIKDKEVENGGSAPRILSLDDYFLVEQENKILVDGKLQSMKKMIYEYEPEMEESYRASFMKSFKKTITDGYFPFIIVDNVNDKVKHFGEMWSFAKQNGFQVYICQMDLDPLQCSKRNIHNRTESEIEEIISGWEPTPSHHPTLDASGLLQTFSITEVEMELDDQSQDADFEQNNDPEDQVRSKWDNFDCSSNNLAKLDGVSKPIRKSETMAEYLKLEDQWEPPKSRTPGKKRVRWADLEEQREQEKMRAIGFVVGQTDWDRMMDPTQGRRVLTQTKYIERVKRY